MSDHGLSIFDDEPEGKSPSVAPAAPKPPAPPAPPRPAGGGLPVVRRGGYDQSAVDARLKELAQQHAQVAGDLAEARKQVTDLETRVQSLTDELAESKNPSYAGLGGRASALLRLAEEEAAEIRANAERDAAEIRDQAARDAKAIRLGATQEMDEARVEHSREIEDRRTRLLADAEQERSLAKAQADDLIAAAKREAEQLRLATEQETTELRSQVQREVEQARAGADREVQEARRMLAVEKERLAREATDFHHTKLAETRSLVEEAEGRASAAEERARVANTTLAASRQQAQADSDSLLARAKKEAEQIVSAARTQAEQLALTGTAEAERALAAIKAEVDRMSKRRDAITAQLASLNDLVARFTHDDEPEDAAAAEEQPAAADGETEDGE